jgi:hypothetical protein
MKKKLAIILTTVVTLAVGVLAPLSAFAQSDEGARPAIKDGLAIVAPLGAPVGKEISMAVFARSTQDPVEGAGIWAVSKDNAEALKQDIATLREQSAAADTDVEAVMKVHGTFLGRTGGNGKLNHTFTQAGVHVLVAVKKGYLPGTTFIHIRNTVKALAVEAPKRSPVGEKVTVTVLQRGVGTPVEDAGVWAVTREDAEALKADVEKLRTDSTTPAEERDYETIVKGRGQFLGKTDKDGKVVNAFKDEGIYVLIAVKKGYVPGYTTIAIKDLPKVLAIRAPGQSPMGKEVKMAVFERNSNDPVAGAGVWALSKESAEALKEDVAKLRDNTAVAAAEKDYEALVNLRGEFLGRTDEQGKLSHTFGKAGGYLLVTAKKGYVPGFTGIRILEKPATEAQTKSDTR